MNLNYKFVELEEKKKIVLHVIVLLCVYKIHKKKCSDIYTEIKSYSIGQIFFIPAKFSLYLSIMWINNIPIVTFVWGQYVVYIDQQKYILLFGRYNHVSTSHKSYNCIISHLMDQIYRKHKYMYTITVELR